MKVETPEKKLTVWSGSVLVFKLFFLLIIVPLFIPVVSWFAQALIWSDLLCRINGIYLAGDLFEAFALSMALGALIACANLVGAVASDGYKKWKNIPLEKLGSGKSSDFRTWDDMFKALPTFRSVLLHITQNTTALALVSYFQPLRVHFDGAPQLLLAASVLSAVWLLSVTFFGLLFYGIILKLQKTGMGDGNKTPGATSAK